MDFLFLVELELEVVVDLLIERAAAVTSLLLCRLAAMAAVGLVSCQVAVAATVMAGEFLPAAAVGLLPGWAAAVAPSVR